MKPKLFLRYSSQRRLLSYLSGKIDCSTSIVSLNPIRYIHIEDLISPMAYNGYELVVWLKSTDIYNVLMVNRGLGINKTPIIQLVKCAI